MNWTPWRHRSWESLEQFRREMEQLVHRVFGEAAGDRSGSAPAWAPQVDLTEDEHAVVIKADLPGVDPASVEVTVHDGVLTLRGEKKEPPADDKAHRHTAERFRGAFYREIPLPPGADVERVHAASAHGVLTITIPKKAEAQPRKIPVVGA
jgi:HSP20 family protein